MKKLPTLLAALALSTAAGAQTLNVVTGSTTYQFPATQAGDMTYADGTTLTVMGKTFALSDIAQMYVDTTTVADNTVSVAYSGTSAAVTIAGNIARYVDASVSGAHVALTQSADFSGTGDTAAEIEYRLSGTSADGEFYLAGAYKTTVSLDGLTLTNPSGAAINIQNGKRVAISVKKDTQNTITDGANGSQKGCLVVKGHTELKGKGTLTVYGKTKHGIKSGEYLSMKNCTVNVLAAEGDGIHCAEYFLMESGTLTVSGVGDDGIQAELDGLTSTGTTTDHEDEDSGSVYISGGTIDVAVTATAAKGIKADGDISVTGGTITAKTSGGGEWDTTSSKTKASAGMSCDGNMTIADGTLTLTATGAGGKGLSGDGTLTIAGGSVTVKTTGGIVYYSNSKLSTTTSSSTVERLGSDYKSSPKGIKFDGAMTISGGELNISAAYHEGIETKSTLDITGGVIYSTSSDDAINSSSHMTITGGTVCAYSTGNDGLDANGNCYIKGGTVYAIGSSSPEVGIDANTEGGYKLYVQGGTIVAIGGLEGGSSLTQSCYSASSWSKSTWYALYNGSDLALAFKTPSSGGTTLVVSTPGTTTLKSGVTPSGTAIWNGMGYTAATIAGGTSVSLSSYSSSSNQPGGGSQPGRGKR